MAQGKLQQSLLCVGQGGVLPSPVWVVFREPLFEEALEGSMTKKGISLELGQRMGNEDIPELGGQRGLPGEANASRTLGMGGQAKGGPASGSTCPEGQQ